MPTMPRGGFDHNPFVRTAGESHLAPTVSAGRDAADIRTRELTPASSYPSSASSVGKERRVRQCGQCLCHLSRYNAETYCSGCARRMSQQSVPTPSVATEIWGQVDVQESLAARDFGRLCHLVRVRSDLRQSDMAQITGLSQAFLSMLESGVRKLTNIDRIVQLLDGLDVPSELTGPMLRTPAAQRPSRFHIA